MLKTLKKLLTEQLIQLKQNITKTLSGCLGRDRTCDQVINSHLFYQLFLINQS